ncbi:MAG: hypothetical protein ACRDAM_22390, partial [Casimicrobium sp.]
MLIQSLYARLADAEIKLQVDTVEMHALVVEVFQAKSRECFYRDALRKEREQFQAQLAAFTQSAVDLISFSKQPSIVVQMTQAQLDDV